MYQETVSGSIQIVNLPNVWVIRIKTSKCNLCFNELQLTLHTQMHCASKSFTAKTKLVLVLNYDQLLQQVQTE